MSPPRILIVKPSSLGDVVHAIPAVVSLSQSFPDAVVDWVVHPGLSPLLDYLGGIVRRRILFDRKRFSGFSLPSSVFGLVGNLRAESYDLVLDFQGLMRSGLMAFAAKSPRKVGFHRPREPLAGVFYTERAPPTSDACHAIERNLRMACHVAGTSFAAPIRPTLPRLPKAEERLSAILKAKGMDSNGTWVGLCPGARWESKRWPASFFAEVADRVQEAAPRARFAILGGAEDKPIATALADACVKARPVSLVGETGLQELFEFARICSAFVTNDSGPMHIAALAGTPLFAMFGATDPSKTGPYWPGHRVFQASCHCLRCLRRYCKQEERLCVSGVSASSVAESVAQELNASKHFECFAAEQASGEVPTTSIDF